MSRLASSSFRVLAVSERQWPRSLVSFIAVTKPDVYRSERQRLTQDTITPAATAHLDFFVMIGESRRCRLQKLPSFSAANVRRFFTRSGPDRVRSIRTIHGASDGDIQQKRRQLFSHRPFRTSLLPYLLSSFQFPVSKLQPSNHHSIVPPPPRASSGSIKYSISRSNSRSSSVGCGGAGGGGGSSGGILTPR
jgi:uncharacterized membrane protein YgcG